MLISINLIETIGYIFKGYFQKCTNRKDDWQSQALFRASLPMLSNTELGLLDDLTVAYKHLETKKIESVFHEKKQIQKK